MARASSRQRRVPHHADRGCSLWSTRSLSFVLVAVLATSALVGCGRDDVDAPELGAWPMTAASEFPLGEWTEVAWLSTDSRDEVSLLDEDTGIRLQGPVTALCWAPALDYRLGEAPLRCGFLIFHERGVHYTGTSLGPGPQKSAGGPLAVDGTLPTVRAAVSATPPEGSTGDVVALITGGESPPHLSSAEAESPPWITSAEVRLAYMQGERLVVGAPEPPAGTNPWRLRAGKFAGEQDNLLVCTYTDAPFDEVIRRRPWIYRITEGDDGLPHLDPRWRGTSFAHPFHDATFGDFTGTGEGEIAALEVGRDGGRMLTAYRFEGFGLEGLAPSIELPDVGDRLDTVQWSGGHEDELVLRATDGRFFFYQLDEAQGKLREVAAVTGPETLLGWVVTSGETGGLVCVQPDGEIWQMSRDDAGDAGRVAAR